MNTLDSMAEEIATAITNGETIEELEEQSDEWAYGFLPVYNDEIIKEWQEMPSEYKNRGSAELGHGREIDIISLMSLDLYLYYSDLWKEALSQVAHLIEELA